MQKTEPKAYTRDIDSTDSTGANPQQIAEFNPEHRNTRKYCLIETFGLTYQNADGTLTLVNGQMLLLYEPASATGVANKRVPLWRAPTDKNSFLPMINGVGDEGNGRALVGRGVVILNPDDSLLIGVAGFPAGKKFFIRGRYWESDTIDELLQYYVGLN